MNLLRSEYPRPQFVRSQWLCLNGEWEFEIDQADSGLERGLGQRPLKDKIFVPFCPESELSGVGNTDFLNAVWYRRKVRIPQEWGNQEVLLHFQAVDYDVTVWVNGSEVRRHRGGFSSFTCELKYAPDAKPGDEIEIVLRARDSHIGAQPRGKQSQLYGNSGCLYTRTTGIWQTVWMEPVPSVHLKRPRLTPDLANGTFDLVQGISATVKGNKIRATLRDEKGEIITVEAVADRDFSLRLPIPIPLERQRLWSVEDPFLYTLVIELVDGRNRVVDHAESYAGFRSVSIQGKKVLLNGKAVFQRLVLDQGYYPDGILTAPSDEALVKDIQLSLEAGFNGARLHQKVFEERFLYHCDRMGYLVWGEFPDWGFIDTGLPNEHIQPGSTYITQWLEVLERDYSHPAIIGWCPLNETGQNLTDRFQTLDDVARGVFLATKLTDQSRPVLDASGYSHRVPETDVYDTHDYEQNPEKFAAHYTGLAEGKPQINPGLYGSKETWSFPYRGQPFFVSEFGGIRWNPEAKPGDASWGYGDAPKTLEEFFTRFEGLCKVLLDNPDMFGYCYTQLTDVFQEQNGIYSFDRSKKFPLDRIRAAQWRPAAIERQG